MFEFMIAINCSMSNHQAYQMNSPPATDTKDIKAMIISMIFILCPQYRQKLLKCISKVQKVNFVL